MKKIPLFLLCLLQVVTGHLFHPDTLENIAVHGDVPQAGNVELNGKKSLTIGEALKLAGYDIAKLETTERPFPVQVTYSYPAERNPDITLDLQTQLTKSLQTSVNLGASIQVIDYEAKLKHLEDLEGQLDSNWEDKPEIAFQRLQEVVHLKDLHRQMEAPSKRKNTLRPQNPLSG